MCLASQANSGRALLDGLERVFDLVEAALGRKDSVVRVVSVSELQITRFVSIGSITGRSDCRP
jgi:hypothetical protein